MGDFPTLSSLYSDETVCFFGIHFKNDDPLHHGICHEECLKNSPLSAKISLGAPMNGGMIKSMSRQRIKNLIEIASEFKNTSLKRALLILEELADKNQANLFEEYLQKNPILPE